MNKFRISDVIKIVFWRLHWLKTRREITGSDSTMEDPRSADVAICAIAVGTDHLKMAHLMLKSLRLIGHFSGPVFIFTDEPDFFSESKNVKTIRIPSRLSIMGIKQFKTWITKCIPFKYVLYVDVDIVIGRDIKPWLDTAKDAADEHPLVLFWDHAATEKYYHSGVFLINRNVYKKISLKWRCQIWLKGYSRDQKTLKRSVRSGTDVQLMPKEDMNFLGQTNAGLDSVATFNHITGRARRLLDLEKLDKFLEHLDAAHLYTD